MATPSYSYMCTNRKDPTSVFEPQTPLPGAGLWWYMSTSGPNEPSYQDYESLSGTPSPTPPASFSSALAEQLRAQSSPSLTIFIHGLDSDWSHAVQFTALLGQNLERAGYRGLVIGFSWPSMGELDGVCYSNGYPPAAKCGSARGNISLSVESFGSLIGWIPQLVDTIPGLQVNIACHSEGNYMLMVGMSPIDRAPLNQVIMLAADVNNGAFQTPPAGLTGQASQTAALSKDVTIYYSSNDSTLALCEGVYSDDHNPSFSGRLGLSGPNYNAGAQQANSIGVDCSAVVNTSYVAALPPDTVPPDTELHVTYFYIPQVLTDMAQTLADTPAHSVVNRRHTAIENSYVMSAVSGW